jgi:hypothetical protein
MRVALVVWLAVSAAQDSKQKYKGVAYEMPAGWKATPTEIGIALMPEGANPNGILEEAYLLVNDPQLKAIDGDKFEETVDQLAEQLQHGAARAGGIEKKKFGELDGRIVRYTADTQNGKKAEIRVYAFMGEASACALVALGYPDVIAKRDKEVEKILGSLSRAVAVAEAEGARNSKRIKGGAAQKFKGIAFDLPQNWKLSVTEQGTTTLVPEGSNPRGIIEEAYALLNDPKIKAIDGEEFEQAMGEIVEKLQPGLKRDGGIDKKTFGDLEGRAARYKGEAGGKAVEIRIHAFMSSQGAAALIVLGYTEVIARRDADVEAILGSMYPCKGGAREELAGSWAHMTNVNAGDGGRRTESILTLNADGTYAWRAESNWSGPAGFGFTAQSETGTWSATDDSLTLKPEGGGEKKFGLEKRNHPKNVNDPMIVLDGQCFVTVYKKPPW